jgi:hypothetical protein
MTKITHDNMDYWMPQDRSLSKWTGGTYAEQLVLALQNDGATIETITDQQVWDKIDLLQDVLDMGGAEYEI